GDKGVRTRLVDGFLSSSGSECLWYARLLKSLNVPDLDGLIFKVLRDQDDVTRLGLLELLSDRADEEGAKVLRGLADTENPRLLSGLVRAAGCLSPADHSAFARDIFESTSDTEVRANAVSCLFQTDPDRYRELIRGWLNSEDAREQNAGVLAAGGSGDWSFMPRLEEMLLEDREGVLIPAILGALRQFSPPGINATVLPYFSHAQESVRLAALDAFTIGDDRELSAVIGLVGDPSEEVHELAKTKILEAEHQNIQLLVKSLGIPRRRLREGLFELLEASDIRDLDVFRFARFHLEKAYGYHGIIDAVRRLPESPARDLLIDHMEQRRSLRLENILRVLVAQDRSGNMRIIWRGLSSADARQRSNSFEALEDSLDASLARILMPLIENLSASESLAVGRKHFQLPKLDGGDVVLLDHLLSKENWVTLVLVLDLIARQGLSGINRRRVTELSVSENPHVALLAGMVVRRLDPSSPGQKEQEMESEISVTDRILHLRRIRIFEALSVNELAAIASVTEESVFEAEKTVFREGDPGDTLYMIVDGEVSIIKEHDDEEGCGEIELARIGSGDYFGEMALFEDVGRSATIRTTRETRVLVLYKREFTEIVREYPEIAIHICRVLSQRIRRQDLKIEGYERKAACKLPADS
ncbi:MAG: cyclic nucleotide-binding domain-containing protein, partial [Deltaproteobacteria bacterium]|nr:cyclic nucleotide-binding domain-containing protein [Deltaproteobacteria bacterium]